MEDKPTPNANNTCCWKCPLYYQDTMPGWPSADACFAWDEEIHGKEPYYLVDTALCMPNLTNLAKSK